MRLHEFYEPIASPRQNPLLAVLPCVDYARLLPDFQLVRLPVGESIYEINAPIARLHFPTDCIAVSLHKLKNGASVTTSATGSEGMVGISCIPGSQNALAPVVVLSEGSAFQIKAALLKKEFQCGGNFHRLLLRFTVALLTQTEQIAVGNCHNNIEQRLSHFLLIIVDRHPHDELYTTHEQVAIFLAVRREGISMATKKLEAIGAVRCRRGHITVCNRREWEELAGEGYAAVAKEYRRLHEYQKILAETILYIAMRTNVHISLCKKGK
ncbi:CRP-like cAMP-binding protein [Nitrosospira sp. Nsp2]|uniref:Crp/Fnr family transcriptional regulator n=1 Tax=Nitrosospira sp. Nsp2 TaxID=136548 RepID=UPI000D319F9E|nr:Crp/Fnr family transcriptional regulator [Nitrosospira sp. Nsp2]PTR17211.1 CRP-like cAMP-binding protein [Nitrosospira sp. Nsp2]